MWFYRLYLTVFLLFPGFIFAFKNNEIIVHLLSTNDLHGSITEDKAYWLNSEHPPDIIGAAGFSKYLQELRYEAWQNGEGILLLDGGNFFQGTPLGMHDGGKTMIAWLNRLGYDALVPGRYDFILGTKNLFELINEADFPFLISNMEFKKDIQVPLNQKPFIIKNIQGINIGIIGIVNSQIPDLVLTENINESQLTMEKPALEKWIPQVKKAGADLVIILTSSGIPWEREKEYEEFLEQLKDGVEPDSLSLNAIEMGYFAEGADLIVSGGKSKGYKSLWYDPFSHVYTVQNYGNSFAHLILKIDKINHTLIGVKSAIDGDVGQSLLADNFQPDLEDLEWIRAKSEIAMNKNYEMPKPNEKLKYEKIIDINPNSLDQWNFPNLNNVNDIEVLTWNCEFFPISNDSTIYAIAEAILEIDVDLIAFQEIIKTGLFSTLMSYLPEYEYIVSQQSSFMDLAIVYKSTIFKLTRQIEPFAENDYNFAGRPPLMGDFIVNINDQTFPLSIINVHMKCCDSGLSRRQKAVEMLHGYVAEEVNAGNTNFIILGDWNDDLKDSYYEHSFHPFLEDDRFYFPTFDITHDLKQASYPHEPYVSFLDHILVTEKLVPRDSGYEIKTIPVDEYMGSMAIYEAYISDHMPVLLSFPVGK